MVALALGVLVRVLPVMGAAAAVGDGGLFLSMTDDLRASGLVIPETTSYNHLDIPFLYPPLALLGAAALGQITGLDSLDVLTWLPLVISLVGLGTFAWLASRVLPSSAAVAATVAYALMPHAYDWVIAGGGLTRGLGLLFALLAMSIAVSARTSMFVPVITGVLLGLSALAHGQAAVFGVIGCIVLTLRWPLRPWLTRLALAGLCAAVVVLPWLAGMIGTHGFDALSSVGHRFDPMTGLIRMLNFRFSGAPFMDVFAVVGVVGVLIRVARRQFRLPILLLATYLAGAGGGEFLGLVPWALLAGVGGALLAEMAVRATEDLGARARRRVMAGLGAAVLFLALVGSLGAVTDASSKLHSLSEDNITAMQWVAQNAPPDATLLVPTNEWWGDDELSEWVPALTNRRSFGTVQGSEWLGFEGFRNQVENHIQLLRCRGGTAACYKAIDGEAFIFAPKGQLAGPFSQQDCCLALRQTLAAAGYRIVYDGPGATIAAPEGAQEGD